MSLDTTTATRQHAPLEGVDTPRPETPTTSAPALASQSKKPADPRRAALLRFAMSITALNVVGHLVLGFEQAPIVPIACVLVGYTTALVLESIDARAYGRAPEYGDNRRDLFYFLLPAHIAALACGMLIYAPSTRYYLFATAVAVSSKYVFRITSRGRLRHYLNPSNSGIVLTLLLFPVVGFVPPYHFTNNVGNPLDWLIPLGVLMLGTMLNAKLTRRSPLILAWVVGYILQAAVRNILFDDPFWAILGMMTGVAFILFTNYMITDPGTTPMSTRGQIAFGLTTATVYGVLISAQVSYAIFFALVATCALRGIQMWVTERRGHAHA